MKKNVFILFLALSFTSCSVDDEGPSFEYDIAEIISNNLPDQFELGETYEVTVTYSLPSACHNFAGIDARRAGNTGEDVRTIYVAAIAAIELGTSCDDTVEGDEGTTKFTIPITEEEDYTFKFLIGEAGGEAVYETVVVPVGQPEV
ncbi:hypothetical protein [Gramella sp. KN1008]|uniref:hypothetical protein n=1 Tax=Gramella sp. KN1008 TaxID=2529298 RepID=UPI0010388407|nr:hypothetical protein [Gramella sp. KN1008]TBW27783.1 hypothetical protein EZJ28_08555 [Gramella sp. KN1008]